MSTTMKPCRIEIPHEPTKECDDKRRALVARLNDKNSESPERMAEREERAAALAKLAVEATQERAKVRSAFSTRRA